GNRDYYIYRDKKQRTKDQRCIADVKDYITKGNLKLFPIFPNSVSEFWFLGFHPFLHTMEGEGGGLDSDAKTPLLKQQSRHSVSSLKGNFLSNLPEKVRSGIDPESPFDVDLSKATGLIEGEKEYYERQFATLKSFEEVDSLEEPQAIDEEHDLREQVLHERAMNISNWANVFLLILKSGSLAIAASTLDSLLDLMAGGILWFTHLSMKNINIYQYPIGKLRVQPVGIIIFAAVMATLGMSLTGCVNLCSRSISQDHYFDVVTNVVGLLAAILGDRFYWWIDPVGAIILAIYTIANWSGTVLENAVSLVGQSAPPEFHQKLTYLVLRHNPLIKRVDTVRAYTFGVLYFVEVDIELPEELPLKEAHAVGESLQIKIEELPEVERAFVHLDYECTHKPEHTVLSRIPDGLD
ncbi:Metal tolerance protein 4, partial [Linum perenne]